MIPILLFFVTFTVVVSWAQTTQDVHVQDIFPAIAFLAATIVAVLGFLLKWLITRDRAGIDKRIDDLHQHIEDRASSNKAYIDGLGVKVEHLADTVAETVNEAVEELRRHDEDIYSQLRDFNRELGQLQGEHEILRRRPPANHQSSRGCPEPK